MPIDETDKAKNLLIKMYLELKFRKNNEREELNKEKISEEKLRLKKLSLIELIIHISNNINILIEIHTNLKYQEKIKREKEIEEDENIKKSLAEQYEDLLIKAENDIRKHIKVSNFLMLTYFYYLYS
jgi:hypothetical protein